VGNPTKKNTVAGDANGGAPETQTIFNDGSCPANVLISSDDALGGVTWNLVNCTEIGQDSFGHQYEIGNSDTVFTGVNMTNDLADTGANLNPGNGDDLTGTDQTSLDLGICMPTGGDSANKAIQVTVTLTAQ
jgi:hypothetical protein